MPSQAPGRRSGPSRSASTLALLLMLVLSPVNPPQIAGGAEDAVPESVEAARLIAGLGELWPAWEDSLSRRAETAGGEREAQTPAGQRPAPTSSGTRPEGPVSDAASQPRAGREAPPPAFRGQFDSGLLDRLASDEAELVEVAVARRVAAAFRAWSESRLPSPPEFIDAGPPAPEEWAVKALRRVRREEARLLARALRASSAKEARAELAGAARQRFRRVALLSAGELFTLRRAEQLEGLPLYTAYHALLLGRHAQDGGNTSTPAGVDYHLAPRLRESLLDALDAVAASDGARYPAEVSGFALALALDRTRHGWREDLLEGDRAIDELLVRPARPFGNQAPGRAPEGTLRDE